MKNKKGQIGVVITVAIGVIVCLILFSAIAGNVQQSTQSNGAKTSVNTTVAAAKLGTMTELAGQELVSVTTVLNVSGGTVEATNYTIAECIRMSDNLKGICYTSLGTSIIGTANASGTVYITYVAYTNGYIDDAGARSIAGIIILLAAIGIALVVLGGSKFDF